MHVLLAKFVAYAAEHPDAEAVIVATTTKREHRYRTVTYAHLHAAINRYRDVLRRRGLRSGERVLLLVPPGEQFIAWSYAVMAADAVPVFLDPAMGAGNLRRCIALAEPRALVGVPLSHALRLLWRRTFRTVRLGVVARDGPLPSASAQQPASSTPAASTPEEAAIMFTSGGTGPPKGAIYLQQTVRAQMEMLAPLADVVPGSRDLPLLPAFALANAAAGACSVYLRPAAKSPLAFDADALIAVVNELRVRSSFGSPALWEKIVAHSERSRSVLPHIEKIFIAGAPVTPQQAARVRSIAPRADVFMPYGCTEALPITFPRASNDDERRAATARGGERGTWIGSAVTGIEVAIAGTNGELRLPAFEIGEIVVRGPNVAPAYAGSPEETRTAKIADDGGAWHRTGDAGYHDGCGGLYFLGRRQHVVHRSGTMFYPIAVERAFDRDPRVRRSALVQLREPDRPAVVVEPHPEHWPRSRRERARFAGELRALVAEDASAAAVREVFFHRSLPVDPRHNAKIQRTQLSEWANRITRKSESRVVKWTATKPHRMQGPLGGVRVLELAGIGPAPFCAMLLADLGADVVRIERAGNAAQADPVTTRGRSTLALDLKSPDDLALALDAVERADVLIEGFRPGVMERLGLGPDVALRRNPRLIYGRMTGWGQNGPLAHAAGHDITYVALTGALAAIGPADGPPVPPLNLAGDFGGGALYLAFGIVAALYERERSGAGQVIDAAVVDGTASLMALFHGMTATGALSLERGRRLLGGDAPNYRCYACADGNYVAIGALEPKFFAQLLERMEIEIPNGADWETASQTLAAAFKRKTRDEWSALFEGTDACVAPVLALDEAPAHPHLRARGTYVESGGVAQPAPAPRFSRTPGAVRGTETDGREALRRWGVEPR